MKMAQTLVEVTHARIHTYILLQNKIEKSYIKNVVCSMSLKLNNYNKDSSLCINQI